VNNLPKVATQRCPDQDLNPRPIDRKTTQTKTLLNQPKIAKIAQFLRL